MSGNSELLNFIFQNSQMGTQSIGQLLEICEDEKFLAHLKKQYSEYEHVEHEAKKLLNSHGYEEKDISGFQKITSYLMINMKTITDKSPSHIAEMLIIGSNMGIVDANKNLNKYKDAEPDIRSLMDKLLTIEENNVKVLKDFL